jgi:HSP20 family protein
MLTLRRENFSDLWVEMARFQDELSRAFGRFVPGQEDPARGAGPLVNVWEDDDAFHAEADLPGLNMDRFEVFVTEGNQLTIQGERPAPEFPEAVWHRQERPFGQFSRTLTLPALVEADQVEARYEQSVLRLTLPKSEAAKPRRIAVKS